MKYIKYFELNTGRKFDELYSCKDFSILGFFDGIKTYRSETRVSYAIFELISLVRIDSKYLNSKKLRKMPISQKEVIFYMNSLSLTPEKITNIEKYRSGAIGEFISNKREELDMIPGKVYMEITFKYYPILENAIDNSKTYGDLIDEYKKIKENILKDVEYTLAAYKYNL